MGAVHRLCCVALLALAGCGKSASTRLQPSLPAAAAVTDPDAQIWYLRATVATLDGDLDEAERSWTWALRLEPGDADLWAHRGEFLAKQRRSDEATEAFERALALDPAQPIANLGLGLLILGRGEPETAVSLLVAAADAGSADGSAIAVRTLHMLGRDGEAAAVLDAWLARPLTRVQELERRGTTALDLGRRALAVDLFVESLERESVGPTTGTLLVGAARSSCRIGTAWRWAVRDRLVDRSEAWRMVAVEIGVSARDPELVETALREGEGVDGDLLFHRVRLLRESGQGERALALLEAAMPTERVVREQARTLSWLGRDDDARTLLRPLMAGEVDSATQIVWAGLLSADEAEAFWEHAPVSEADRWRYVASTRYARGDLPGALDALKHTDGAITRLTRARLLDQAGEPSLAAWRAVVAGDPGAVEGWLALARLVPDERDAAVRAALEADPCDASALLARASEESGCAALPFLERALDAAPTDRDVLAAAASAYHACGAEDGPRAREGLLSLEQSWRALSDTEQVEAVARLRHTLESP